MIKQLTQHTKVGVAKLGPELTNLCFEPLYYTTLLGYPETVTPPERFASSSQLSSWGSSR